MKVRRVVTGHDATGKAVIWKDDFSANQFRPVDKIVVSLMWLTDETPFDFTRSEDMGERKVGTAPPAGGTRFAVLEIEPGNEFHGLHRTDSVDYVICLAGEIDMHLDESVVKLAAGDVLIQRGTHHAWVNCGAVPARLAVILVDGKPKRAGSVSGKQLAR
jgi:quercetin dioxygenase-like cupin family protein